MTRTILRLACALGAGLLAVPRPSSAAELEWKGYSWSVTNGGMAGVAAGSSANVSVDASGYLHLKVQKNGATWTAAEIFTTTRLGFGTYQWQIDGPIDTLDKNIVLGLFPYGPAAGIGSDGTNEIDIEYSRWGQENGANGDWTNYPASGATVGELSYTFTLGGETLSTSRFIWTHSSIEDFLFAGLQPATSVQSLLKSWRYAPANPTLNIPQQALPLGMNLWCFDLPSDGKNVEIIVRDFQFLPEGASTAGSGGGSADAGGSAGGGSGGSSGGPGGGGTASSSLGGTLNAGGARVAEGGTSTAAGGASISGASNPGDLPVDGSAGKIATTKSDSASCGVALIPSAPRAGLSPAWFALLVPFVRARRRKFRG